MSSHMEQQFMPMPDEGPSSIESGDSPAIQTPAHPHNPVPAAAPSSSSKNGKRAAPETPGSANPPREKVQRISRSCDLCHRRNMKCSGFKPCYNCSSRGDNCTYDRPYTRGIARTPPPPPENDRGEARNWAQPFNEKGKEHRDKGWAMRSCDHCRTHQVRCTGKRPCEACFKERLECSYKMRARQRPSAVGVPQTPDGDDEGPSEEMSFQAMDADSAEHAQDIVSLQFPTLYAAEDTPPLVFLHKAWRRISQALESATLPPASDDVTNQLTLAAGDQPFDTSKPQVFPDALVKWWEMQDKFGIGWTETFHFIHRLTAKSWTDVLYKNWSARAPLDYSIGPAKASIAILTMAIGSMFYNSRWRPGKKEQMWNWLYTLNNGDQLFQITIRLTDSEPGPPTLESVQARLLQSLYLLCTCRLGQAWYVFGNVVNMITALGLHRRRGRNRGLGPEVVLHPEYAKIQCERRTFWSAYVIDKQIALMSGRPSYFNLDITDQDLPDSVNDEDMGRAGPFRPHKGDCYLEALIEQAKLAKIIEKVMRQVYTLDPEVSEDERLERAWRLGAAVEDWKAKLPYLMGRIKLSLLHLTYRRQATLLQLAHWHAQILVYRPFLTAAYPSDREKKRIADQAIRNCVEASRALLAATVNLAREQSERDKSHFHTILYAHHVTYSAAAVVFILPHIRERQRLHSGGAHNLKPETDARLFELAQKAIKAMVENTNKYSPARRWAVILEELRDEAARQVPGEYHQANQGNLASEQDGDAELESPDEQLLEDVLRAHWDADLVRESLRNNDATAAEPAPPIVPRLWDKWKTTDWLDVDSAAFGPISAFGRDDLPIAPPQP